MTPEAFVAKWRGVELSERAASQDHFNERCELLDLEKPVPKAGGSPREERLASQQEQRFRAMLPRI
jgi:hypothetical protein